MKRLLILYTLLSILTKFLGANVVPFTGKISVDGVNYQGEAQFRFSLHDGNGSTYWQNSSSGETIKINVYNGRYQVFLGGQGMSPLTPDLFLNHGRLFLKVEFDSGDGKSFRHLAPDQLITSTPKALVADVARVANSVMSGSVTKDMLASELVNELSTEVIGKSSLGKSIVLALPLDKNPPEGMMAVDMTTNSSLITVANTLRSKG